MISAASMSAIVRASFRMRWNERADSESCAIARRSSDCACSSRRVWQNSRTSVGVISALQTNRVPSNRARCSCRASSTRSRTVSDVSPVASDDSFSYSTRGTSTKMSIRSSNGPDMRFW